MPWCHLGPLVLHFPGPFLLRFFAPLVPWCLVLVVILGLCSVGLDPLFLHLLVLWSSGPLVPRSFGLLILSFEFLSVWLLRLFVGVMQLLRLWLFASSALPDSLRQVAFWLCGFGFGFLHPLLSQLVFGRGFLHPQHRQFLLPPFQLKCHPLSNHQFFDHHGGGQPPTTMSAPFVLCIACLLVSFPRPGMDFLNLLETLIDFGPEPTRRFPGT